MKLSLLVLGAPFSSQASYSAYRFARAALLSGHSIYRVFLYQDGVHTSNALSSPPQDELNLCEAWQSLQQQYKLDIVTCIAAASRRGVMNEREAKRNEKTGHNLLAGFELSGLGQLIEADVQSDRLITFGA